MATFNYKKWVTENKYGKISEFKELVRSVIKEEAFGSNKAIPLSQIPDAAAKAALDGGKNDGNDKDDVAAAGNKPIAVGSLYPMQKEVIPAKALAFALGFASNATPDLEDMEAIVSSDNYIMDGHHRWAARTLLDPGASVTVSKVDMPADDVVTALNVYTKAKGYKGNPGEGDVKQFATLIPGVIDTFVTKGADGYGKASWPMTGKKPEEIKQIIADKIGKGDFEEGKATLIANAEKLNTNMHPNAPERVEMPVIDAGKGDLKAVLQKLNTGELDFKPPYSPEVSKNLKGGTAKQAEPIQEAKRLQKLKESKDPRSSLYERIEKLINKQK